MPSILETLNATLNSDTIGRLSKVVGADTSGVSKAVGAIGPLVLSTLARRAAQPSGGSLLNTLPTDGGSGVLSNLVGVITGGFTGGHAKMVTSMLGPGTGAIGSTLSRRLGFDARPILALVTPLVGGIVGKMAKEQNLSAPSLANVLETQASTFLNDPKNADSAAIANEALGAATSAETVQAKFTAEEWTNIRLAPMAAMFAVAGASPSGPIGVMKEGNAAANALKEAATAAPPTSLLAIAFGDGQFADEVKEMGASSPTKEKAVSIIASAITAVTEKLPDESATFRDTIMSVGERAAAASKEGGFLGIGGTQVSDKEQAVLDELRTAMR